jgi:hypothetical protein
MSRYRAILNRIDTWSAEQQRVDDVEDLEQIAETTRRRILSYLEARRNGEPLPVLEPHADHDSPARERLRARLAETGQRLRRYAALGERYGVR